MDEWIAKEDLVIGKKYKCRARNFDVGTWNGEAFEYHRKKFNTVLKDREFHWDDGAPFGTVKPLWEVE
jgi:hypothetical protein